MIVITNPPSKITEEERALLTSSDRYLFKGGVITLSRDGAPYAVWNCLQSDAPEGLTEMFKVIDGVEDEPEQS